MLKLGLFPGKEKELALRMQRLHVLEEDIEETFIRSSGPGGQNVNKVSSCVCLYHRPTHLSVKCQQERSQSLNRYRARCLLLEKIEQRQKEIRQKQIQIKEKERRKNRQRSRAVKERILENKKKRSEKKGIRSQIPSYKWQEYD